MSSPSEQGKGSGEDRKGLSKFIRRASRVLRPKSVGSVPSELAVAQGEPSSAQLEAAPPTTEAKSVGPLSSHPSTAPVAAKATMPSETRDIPAHLNVHKATDPSPVQIPRRDIKDAKSLGKNQQEKAQLLFAKYGLTLEAKDWTPLSRSGAGEVQWVEKKVRLRVHRQCHHCSTSFGSTRECVSCSHVRCKKCPRFPIKPESAAAAAPAPTEGVAKAQKETELADVAQVGTSDVEMGGVADEDNVDLAALVAPPIHLQIDPKDQTDKHILQSTSGIYQYRGQNVQYRSPTHRVRRFCHKCKALFKGRATSCESCGHQRCPECPREPYVDALSSHLKNVRANMVYRHKPAKYPNGYPGDVPEPEPLYPTLERVWRKPRHRVRYTCDNCHTVFSNSGERECRECKHVRCNSCIRYPPMKPAKKQSEEVLKSLEGKFDGLQLLSH